MIGKILGLNPDQVQAAKFAIKKHREGYTLLRNPKGTPNTEVNLVRTGHGLSLDEFYDKTSFIDRIKATFNKGKKEESAVLLNSTRFRDPETKELSRKRNVEYYKYDFTKNEEIEKRRLDISEEDLAKRKKPRWRKGFLSHEYFTEHYNEEVKYNPNNTPYYSEPGARFMVPILSFGLFHDNRPTRPNFYKVLWDNLHNGTKK